MSKDTSTPAPFSAPAPLDVCDADLDHIEGGQPTDAQLVAGIAVVTGGAVAIFAVAAALIGYGISHP